MFYPLFKEFCIPGRLPLVEYTPPQPLCDSACNRRVGKSIKPLERIKPIRSKAKSTNRTTQANQIKSQINQLNQEPTSKKATMIDPIASMGQRRALVVTFRRPTMSSGLRKGWALAQGSPPPSCAISITVYQARLALYYYYLSYQMAIRREIE